MEPGFLKDWLSIISTLLAIGGIFYAWLTRTGAEAGKAVVTLRIDVDKQCGDLRGKVEVLEDRVSKLEGEMRHLPDKESAHRMELAIARLEGQIETMNERLKPVGAIAERMQDYMLESRK